MADTGVEDVNPSGVWTKYGGRRFVMCMGAGMVFTALLVGAYIDQHVYQFLIISTIGAYITGNTAQKVMVK